MKIVIIGGTGLIGSKLVAILRARGDEALAASPIRHRSPMTPSSHSSPPPARICWPQKRKRT